MMDSHPRLGWRARLATECENQGSMRPGPPRRPRSEIHQMMEMLRSQLCASCGRWEHFCSLTEVVQCYRGQLTESKRALEIGAKFGNSSGGQVLRTKNKCCQNFRYRRDPIQSNSEEMNMGAVILQKVNKRP